MSIRYNRQYKVAAPDNEEVIGFLDGEGVYLGGGGPSGGGNSGGGTGGGTGDGNTGGGEDVPDDNNPVDPLPTEVNYEIAISSNLENEVGDKIKLKYEVRSQDTIIDSDEILLSDGSTDGKSIPKSVISDSVLNIFLENKGTITDNYGHIDHGFLLIDDDTVIHAGIEWVPLALRNKKLIDVKKYVGKVVIDNYIKDYTATDGRYSNAWLEQYLANWRGYTQEVCFDLNVLILDSKNILFGKHLPELFQYLKTFNINCHVVPQRHEVYWEGGTHCCTLDVKRKGSKRKII